MSVNYIIATPRTKQRTGATVDLSHLDPPKPRISTISSRLSHDHYSPLSSITSTRKSSKILASRAYPTPAMRTPKQIAASRVNGARSKGPATPEGKRNSSRNSTRHGRFADTLVLEKETATQFLELLNELLDEQEPPTPSEPALLDAADPASQPKKNDFAKRTHQPIENATHAAPLEPSDAADLAPQPKKMILQNEPTTRWKYSAGRRRLFQSVSS